MLVMHQQGVLAIKLHEFYDSAGLMAVYKLHKTLAKKKFYGIEELNTAN